MNVSTSTHLSTRPVRHVLRQATLVSAVLATIACAAFATVAALCDHFALDLMTTPSSAGPTSTSMTMSTGSVAVSLSTMPTSPVERLVEQHHCWTGAADLPSDLEGRLPGHVVVTTAAKPHEPVYSADLVGPALDAVFAPAGRDPGLTVHAFCR